MNTYYLTKHIYHDTDWHQAHNRTLLVFPEGNSENPVFTDIPVKEAILKDMYRYLPAEAHAFLQESIDNHTLTEEHPAIMDYREYLDKEQDPDDYISKQISCWYSNQEFSVAHCFLDADAGDYITYQVWDAQNPNLVFLPLATWYRGLKYGDTMEHLFTLETFQTYQEAKAWVDTFEETHENVHGYDTIAILPANIALTRETRWYRMQQDILTHTNGYTDLFIDKFHIASHVMYQNLLGRQAYEQLCEDCPNPVI